jgi:S-adenosylmethionine:tRNA ribosyltransferase-isomerase
VAALTEAGIDFTFVTLHVGAGTFLPVTVDDVTTHRMHAEWGEVRERPPTRSTRPARGGRIIPVGTTALRLIETAAAEDGTMRPFEGDTDIFIYPGYALEGDRRADDQFPPAEIDADDAGLRADGARARDGDLRPRHRAEYRFFSYGDASLLIPSRK